MVNQLQYLQKAILKVGSNGGSKATTKSDAVTLLFSAALMCSPIAFANTSASDSTSVNVESAFTVQVFNSRSQTEHLQLNYTQAVRLEQVLADTVANLSLLTVSNAATNQPIYWTGASLFQGFPHPEKAHVVTQLEKTAQLVDVDEKGSFQQLAEQIDQYNIGARVFTPLDYDFVRIDKSSNPMVSAQQYSEPLTLVVPSRPDSVWVLGAIENNGKQPWQPRTSASKYLKQAGSTAYGDNSVTTVIQPDGTVEQHPIAYWNKSHMDIAPGAIVYLSFDNLPTGYRHLNDEIINLLRNKAL
ncbi:polysaccharide synthesis [Photobacterium gaetbulicola]|uniref:Putative polysaccharide synthesis-like protein n=1 Tax=Photobacterium gaetbulicola Gung47 TaxID=658445 RepID=A0A0C5WQQ4_9GAMM|nr:capsule biosynthesis GfcC family protein [Photobacterium gaetbulicola]AJR09508.1 putative polysaccharide synthesis-like protein [Photobacterium gaetbulicola Gung47]PSU14303.1 polysaccharide synthesis [Photobacterium gaetbulicola]